MTQVTNQAKEASRLHYISRINKVLDYIERHIDENLSLEIIAEEASFSPFHFHRIFSSITGETLNNFIRRKRLEKSASLLVGGNIAISEIVVNCGFNSNAAFARAFKEHFQMNASEFRNGGYKEYNLRMGYDSEHSKKYFERMLPLSEELLKDKQKPNHEVEIRNYESFTVAYCRHVGRFQDIGVAYEKLFKWAGPRGLTELPDTKVLTLYHDDPNVTSIEKLYQSACISIDPKVKTEGEIGKMQVAGGSYACARFEIEAEDFSEAWASMYAGWLPESGYECDNRLPFELYYKSSDEKRRIFIFDICIPVKLAGSF